jgi:hypothetical protein
MSRLATAFKIEVVPVSQPFSNFDFVDDRFQGSFPEFFTDPLAD